MDLALRHGCISILENGEYKIIYRYVNSKIKLNLEPLQAFHEINLLASTIYQHIQTYPKHIPIAIDLDVNTFFRSKNIQKVYTGAFMYAIIDNLSDYNIVLVKPSAIRSMLGLTNRSKKDIVIKKACGIIPYIKSSDMDEMDSFLLCHYLTTIGRN